ncbi:YciI family protein [Brevibacterium spongiae]|uniref:YciI family protein n=1 Tax=Brevibacterium spongiae TaxID=2909672 RepID=A0ABY5SQZ8_9MICO|nr:YciI family protein [Brevibacterium spongiae]UVI36977.1 YciI family protein [Brevibacterium spongiae]
MKFMLIMRTVDQAAVERMAEADFEEMIAAMGAFNESMVNAGVLSDGAGLADPSEGAVVDFSGTEPTSTTGAYGTLRELFNGFWIVDVATQDEAITWAKKAPLETGSQIEVRRVNGPEDFPEDNEWVQKEQEWIEQGRLDKG